MNAKRILQITGISGALAVGLGAFGAHDLESILVQNGRLDTFQTAVNYHFYHTLALLGLGVLALVKPQWKGFALTTWCILLGILIFSGSLYVLSLTGITWLGAITPLGGIAFILGWGSLFYLSLKNK
ncbi:MAG: DUF423 domain-containing protein [Bacteroidetes bacterium]|nr:DUF423 domain-containing protein [Bacteroidota bacterium]MDA1269113.1 DUF423 domain-containing protein [Bacteroidota bacterium]